MSGLIPVETKLRVRGFWSRSTRPKEIEERVELARTVRTELKEAARDELSRTREMREEMAEVKSTMERMRRVHRDAIREVRRRAF
ncbi:MAG: hypothetical protein NZ733_03295 [Aigarchaeota archaeon]|nr:hypothetical protein [Aigarchaeota archaeon]MCX8203539.1 hypothetical protein [Nitrososphaeria archaeon]MDW8043713.1 hypothetical protein [Nitrososphaerota archaeon]